MKNTLLVAAGGAFGSVLRFWLGGWVASQASTQIWAPHLGTLFVNVTGSFVIGAIDALFSSQPWVRYFLMVGVMGGYTTFSSFSLQTLDLLNKGQVTLALVNVASSVILCILGVWLGFMAGRAIS